MANHLVQVGQQLEHDKSLVSMFNANRVDDTLRWRSECQYALEIMKRNAEGFQDIDMDTVKRAMLEVAYSGLTLAPSLGHAYLIPRGNVCTFHPGYKGIMHLCYKANTLARIQPGLHKKSDTEWEVFTDEHGQHIIHRESDAPKRSEEPTLHAYVIAKLTNHEHVITVMDAAALAAVEKAATHVWKKVDGRSKLVEDRRAGMVWRGPFRSQMEIKAVIRRASSYWPKDDGGRMEHAITVMDKYDPVQFAPQDVEQQPAELLINEEQQIQLHAALTDRGLSGEEADHWLAMKAKALGIRAITDLPARLFEQTKADLVDRHKKWQEARA